jgi:hypothetical protein
VVLCILVLAILELSTLVLSLILRIGVLCVLVMTSLVLRRVSIILLLAVGHVVGIHGIHVLVMMMLLLLLVLGNKGRRRLPPTRRPGTADHIGAVNTSSSLYILPSRQMAVTHRAGLGIE